MKVFCSKDTLLYGVNTVQKAVSNKNTLPILQGICVKATGQTLIFEGTDLEMGIRCQVPAQIITEGMVVLPAKLFSGMVRKLPDTTITLELNDDKLTIHYFQSNVSIKSFDPEEFPVIPELFDDALTFDLSTYLFKSMIKQTIFACSSDESRPVFTGVLIQVEENTIKFIGTDTHRLAYKSAQISNPNNIKFMGIIPSKTLAEIYRLVREDDEIISISFNKSQIFFEFGPVQLLSRLIEGQFPNYKQVIPQNCETKIKIMVNDFSDSVERASLVAREGSSKTNIVRLRIEEQQLSIEHASDMGRISEQMEIEQQGNNLTISFNAKFLLDALKVIDSEQILIEMSGPISPGVMRPLDESDYLYLVLPVRNA